MLGPGISAFWGHLEFTLHSWLFKFHSSSYAGSVLSRKNWRPEEVLIPATLVLVMAAMSIAALFAGPLKGDPTQLAGLWLQVFVFQVPTLLLVQRFLGRHETSWADGFGFLNQTPRQLMGWLAVTIPASVIGLYGLHQASNGLLHWAGGAVEVQSSVKVLLAGSMGVKISVAFIAILIAPAVEESVFRGILFPFCRDLGWRWPGLIGTSVLFGVVHANLATLLPLSVFGMLLCRLYERTGNLLICILTHAGFNAVSVTLAFAGWLEG